MIGIRHRFGLYLTTAAIVALAWQDAPLRAQAISDRVLSDVTTQSVGQCAIVAINFNVRVQVISFFPEKSGRELRIQLRSLDRAVGSSTLRESLRPPPGIPALRDIEYEGDSSRGEMLSLFFNRDVGFTVAPGVRPQTILISISESGDACAGGTDATAGPAQPAGTAAPQGAKPVVVPDIPIPEGLYVVNVLSQTSPLADLPEAQRRKIADYVSYETQFERDGLTWHRLRVGFFATREKAEAVRATLAGSFAEAFVTKVTAQEREQGVANRLFKSSQPRSLPAPAPAALTPEQAEAAAKAEADAEAALKAGDNDRATQLLTKALTLPENPRTPRALELLGLVRERKGQAAQARAEYEEYLRRYPVGEDADRIRQRLAALSAPAGQAPPELRSVSGKPQQAAAANSWHWGARGSFSQFYFRDQSATKFLDATVVKPNAEIDNNVNLSQLLTNADVSMTGGNDRYQLLLRAAGSYSKDFRPNGKDFTTLTALYLDLQDTRLNLSARLGRQTLNSAGVLGRFDGGLIGWRVKSDIRVNLVAGFPVLTSRQTHVLEDRFFYGASINFGSRNDKLQTTLYWFDERTHGLIDRQAVGAEARYINNRFNAYAVLDYDVHFSRLNLGLLTANYVFPDQSSLSLSADYRQSPLLTTTNAIIGQYQPGGLVPIVNVGQLRPFFTDAQIYQLARDATLVAKSATLTYSRRLTKKLQTNLDFTITDTGGTPGTTVVTEGSLPIEPLPALGQEYYYGAQLVGNGLLFGNDIYIVGARYADNQRARTYTFDINARIPVSAKLRISPRARYGMRNDKLTASTFRQFQPTMRMNFYPLRSSEIEVELGANFAQQHMVIGTTDTTNTEHGLLATIGYRLDF
ncbi:SPOR domain-containing protein [Sandarakinorhabdus oryzae]|uniref:SPOR domain-containing protein n=1 Tax=Sandarakinorhabdus oryzae TaxID=2675220 RepID=UPI0012E19034|nr:SPOR domain-containing protein [Sandarakinorhabdus oryzae]